MGELQLLTTRELSKIFRVDPGTIRRAFCTTGHYMGLRPVKLPNQRLMWNERDADKVAGGEKIK